MNNDNEKLTSKIPSDINEQITSEELENLSPEEYEQVSKYIFDNLELPDASPELKERIRAAFRAEYGIGIQENSPSFFQKLVSFRFNELTSFSNPYVLAATILITIGVGFVIYKLVINPTGTPPTKNGELITIKDPKQNTPAPSPSPKVDKPDNAIITQTPSPSPTVTSKINDNQGSKVAVNKKPIHKRNNDSSINLPVVPPVISLRGSEQTKILASVETIYVDSLGEDSDSKEFRKNIIKLLQDKITIFSDQDFITGVPDATITRDTEQSNIIVLKTRNRKIIWQLIIKGDKPELQTSYIVNSLINDIERAKLEEKSKQESSKETNE